VVMILAAVVLLLPLVGAVRGRLRRAGVAADTD